MKKVRTIFFLKLLKFLKKEIFELKSSFKNLIFIFIFPIFLCWLALDPIRETFLGIKSENFMILFLILVTYIQYISESILIEKRNKTWEILLQTTNLNFLIISKMLIAIFISLILFLFFYFFTYLFKKELEINLIFTINSYLLVILIGYLQMTLSIVNSDEKYGQMINSVIILGIFISIIFLLFYFKIMLTNIFLLLFFLFFILFFHLFLLRLFKNKEYFIKKLM